MAAAKDSAKETSKEATSVVEKTADAASSEKKASENGAPSKKSLGPKEPPAFAWKLVGESCGYVLTLFKAAEREDVEAQFQRLTREGYYKGLQILDINAVVKQPNPPKAAAEKKNSRTSATGKATPKSKKAAYKPVIARPKVRSASAKSKVETKSTKKVAPKSKASKSKASKSTAKKSAGKKSSGAKATTKRSTAQKASAEKASPKKPGTKKAATKKKSASRKLAKKK